MKEEMCWSATGEFDFAGGARRQALVEVAEEAGLTCPAAVSDLFLLEASPDEVVFISISV